MSKVFLYFFSLLFFLSYSFAGNEKEKKSTKKTAKINKVSMNNSKINNEYRNELELVACLFESYQIEDNAYILLCEINLQMLQLYTIDTYIKCFSVSTSEKGIGNQDGSFQTPLGMHKIDEMFCENCPEGTVIKGLKKTKEKVKIFNDSTVLKGDYLTTRVITLNGLDKGKNAGGNFDSRKRGVMIHGTPEEGYIGSPKSKGCIRMYNDEIVQLMEILKNKKNIYLYIME